MENEPIRETEPKRVEPNEEEQKVLKELADATKRRDRGMVAKLSDKIKKMLKENKVGKEVLRSEFCHRSMDEYMKCRYKPITLIHPWMVESAPARFCLRPMGSKCVLEEEKPQ